MINFKWIFLFFLCLGCIKTTNKTSQTKILGHKGSGTLGKYNNPYFDNSIDAILYAITNFDGAEVDVQMSKDKTLWLYHDNTIKSCDDSLINFCLLSDYEILSYSLCNYENTLSTLSNLFTLLNTSDINKTFLSLDLKGLINPLTLKLYGKPFLFNHFIEEIIKVNSSNNINLAVESKHVEFLTALKESSNKIETYLLEFNGLLPGINLASKNKIDGVSVHFKKIISAPFLIKTAHDKKLKIQTWTPSNPNDLNKILNFPVDYIQTDNLGFFIN